MNQIYCFIVKSETFHLVVKFNISFFIQSYMMRRAGGLREEIRNQKVVSSNPGTGYWMDIFHIYLL